MKRAFLPILALALVAPLGAAHEDGGPICVFHVWGDFSPAATMNTARSLVKHGKDYLTKPDLGFIDWENALRDVRDGRKTLAEIKKDEVTPEVQACREEVEAAIVEVLVAGFRLYYGTATTMIDSPAFAQALFPLNRIEPILIEENTDERFDLLIDLIEEARKTIDLILEDAGVEYAFNRDKIG